MKIQTSLHIFLALILINNALCALPTITLSGPVTSAFSNGRLTLSDSICGNVVISTNDQTKFTSTGLALSTPNDVRAIVNAIDCTAAGMSVATHVAALPPGTATSSVVARINCGGMGENIVPPFSVQICISLFIF